jgi:hypothetical protein
MQLRTKINQALAVLGLVVVGELTGGLEGLSSNGGRDTGFDLGRGLVSWPCIGQPLACPLVARCEPSRGSQVKAGVAPTTRDRRVSATTAMEPPKLISLRALRIPTERFFNYTVHSNEKLLAAAWLRLYTPVTR